MKKEIVGFSSVSENEMINVDGGAIPLIVVIAIACVSIGCGIGLGYLINK